MARKQEPSPWRFAGVGLELGGVVVVMAFLGHAFDRWQGTHPWGVLTGSTIGICGGLYNLVKQVIREPGGERERKNETTNEDEDRPD